MTSEINLPIYMDYASTTPVDPRVAHKISDHLTLDGNFGNPASRSHKFGWKAEEAVEEARSHVANLVNCDPREIVWTSGATEADNLAIKGIANFYQKNGKHIITSKIEHKAVLDPCRQLERDGFEVTYLEPNEGGLITPEAVSNAIREDTVLISIMHINNELGTINDLTGIGKIAREKSIFFHVDAAQSTGKVAIDLSSLPVDLMSFSAHKTYGPKGIGALFVRRKPRVRIEAQIHGGGHERGMRSGTLAVPLIVGFGKAISLSLKDLDKESRRLKGLQKKIINQIKKAHPDSILNGTHELRLYNNINFTFPGIDAETLISKMKSIACSTGSACSNSNFEPSHVIKALGHSDEFAHSAVRFSLGRYNSEYEVDNALKEIINVVQLMKNKLPRFKK